MDDVVVSWAGLKCLPTVLGTVLQARSELLNGLSAAYTAQASEGEGGTQKTSKARPQLEPLMHLCCMLLVRGTCRQCG